MKKLSSLIERLDYELLCGSTDIDITSVEYDSRKVSEGSLFICISGANSDGHRFIPDVISQGAACIVVSENVLSKDSFGVTIPDGITVIKVSDTRLALALISAAWFGHPAEHLTVIGITGTKGKTTTTYLVKNILEHAGLSCGLIGTIEVIIGDEHIHTANTTPESYLIQDYFSQMVKKGIKYVVMEVSSQGLMLHRTSGFTFDIGIFTNLEPDHIGPNEHKDLDDYIYCKSLLFKQCRQGIFNADDEHLPRILEGHTCKVVKYGLGDNADIRADNIRLINDPGILGAEFDVHMPDKSIHITIPNPGTFSVYNALCAISICHVLGIDTQTMHEGLLKTFVKGRAEHIHISDDYTLLIDYAHNAMALKSLLTTLREYNPKRLVCVFGCGGNRSRSRRFEMGEVSGNLADLTIITSDNPRFEEPLDIIADIRTGISKTTGSYIEIPDRREAIKYAIENALPGDIIILAGKGHEDYQEIAGVKYPMDERDIIADILRHDVP